MPVKRSYPGGVWFKPKIPRDKPCRFCRLPALHRSLYDCIRELKEERGVFLTLLKQRERSKWGGVVLCCPFCWNPLLQLEAAMTIGKGDMLKRVYYCDSCKEPFVTRESFSVVSLYQAAGFLKRPGKGAGMLKWDEKMMEKVLRDAEAELGEDYEEGPDPFDPAPPESD